MSFIEWRGGVQRPHHLARELARRGWAVTWCSPGYLHRRGGVESGLARPGGLRVLEPAALPGGRLWGAVRRFNAVWMTQRLLQAAPKAGGWDAVIFNDPRMAERAARMPARRRIFDCMDDLRAQAGRGETLDAAERRALRVADRVWTGTWSLCERLKALPEAHGKPLRFVPCGVDAALFANGGRELTAAEERELPAGEGPLAGYFGVLNERVDARRLGALLEAGWRIVLIGPATSRMPALPRDARLRWIGPRPYAELPGWLARFDLALIPYDTQGPHRYLYPVKALEYLAGGKPVLSTPLPDVERFLKDYVELADEPAAWRGAGERLLRERSAAEAKAAAGAAYARGRSWEAMVDEMERDLEADR